MLDADRYRPSRAPGIVIPHRAPTGRRLRTPDVLGLRPRQVDRDRRLFALPRAQPRARGQESTRSSTCTQSCSSRGRLSERLVPAHAARPALDQPARPPRALLRRPPDRGGGRLLPGHRQAQAARRHVPLCRPHRHGLRPRRRPEARLLRPRGDRAGAGQARPRHRRAALSRPRASYFIDAARPAAALLRRGGDAARRATRTTSIHKTYEYNQSHQPVREQDKVVGHAVRAMYLYSGMADVATEYRRRQPDARRSSGSGTTSPPSRCMSPAASARRRSNEGFTDDYDLPNESAYAETCAAVGLVFWASRMLGRGPDRRYADMMELALYNGAMSGPLARRLAPSSTRTRWRAAASTTAGPGIAARAARPTSPALLASIGSYMYAVADDEIAVHLYGDSTRPLRPSAARR